LRRVRGGRSKDRGLVLNAAALAGEDWITYLLILFCGLIGVLLGFLIGKISSPLIVLIVVIFLGLITAGLIVTWAIEQKTQLLELRSLQESLKQQYNAFMMLISELEHNLSLDNGEQVCDKAWQVLQYELALFPSHIYEELNNAYRRLYELSDLESIDYRQVILEENF